MGECVSMKDTDDNLTDDFFELKLDDIKLLHAENIKRAKEAEEGAQVSPYLQKCCHGFEAKVGWLNGAIIAALIYVYYISAYDSTIARFSS